MKGAKLVFLIGISWPCLTAIEESDDDAGIVHCHLSCGGEFGILPDPGRYSAK